MKCISNWVISERKTPDRVRLCFTLKATIAEFITITILALSGCGDTPSIKGPNHKAPISNPSLMFCSDIGNNSSCGTCIWMKVGTLGLIL